MKYLHKNVIWILGVFFIFALTLFGVLTEATAQDTPASMDESIYQNYDENMALHHLKVQRSLFFMPNDIAAIMSARRGYVPSQDVYQDETVDLGPRFIKLAGIMYINRNDWVIWLNDQKITPDNIPERIVHLDVYRDRIHIKWHDVGLQRIVSFSMKPHQRFHLDTGLLLPG